MGADTKIEWTDATWNPWQGCRKVSQGCKFCYMYREKERYGQDPRAVVRSANATFRGPLSTAKFAPGTRVFTCSWSDWFIEEADAWRSEAWDIVRQRPDLTFQVLTKRADRIAAHLPADWGEGWPNVWLGVSVENQDAADERIPHLLQVPARVRFLSCEPLLGRVYIEPYLWQTAPNTAGPWRDWTGKVVQPAMGIGGHAMSQRPSRYLHWVIAGGESGPQARVSHPDWFRFLRDQCTAADVAFHFKQWGEWRPATRDDLHYLVQSLALDRDGRRKEVTEAFDPVAGDVIVLRAGKAAAGRELDGRTWDELPPVDVSRSPQITLGLEGS